MRFVSSSLLSVVLAVSMLSIGAVVERVTNVYVTNFPLDTQGNLKVSPTSVTPSWREIKIAENLNLTWTPSFGQESTNMMNLGLFNITGYSRMKLYALVTNYTLVNQGSANYAAVRISIASKYDFLETPVHTNLYVDWGWTETGQKLSEFYPSSYYEMLATSEPSLRIFIQGVSNTPSGPLPSTISCLVSVGIYLRNE